MRQFSLILVVLVTVLGMEARAGHLFPHCARARTRRVCCLPAYDYRENLAQKLWKYAKTVDDWLGGGLTTQRERDRRAKLEFLDIYYYHGLMKKN